MGSGFVEFGHVGPEKGIGKGQQFASAGEVDIQLTVHDCFQIDLVSKQFSTLTECFGMPVGSVKTLIERRYPRRNNLRLGPRQALMMLIVKFHEMSRRHILNLFQIMMRLVFVRDQAQTTHDIGLPRTKERQTKVSAIRTSGYGWNPCFFQYGRGGTVPGRLARLGRRQRS